MRGTVNVEPGYYAERVKTTVDSPPIPQGFPDAFQVWLLRASAKTRKYPMRFRTYGSPVTTQ